MPVRLGGGEARLVLGEALLSAEPWASLWLDGIILFLPSMAAPRRVAHAGARLLALP